LDMTVMTVSVLHVASSNHECVAVKDPVMLS